MALTTNLGLLKPDRHDFVSVQTDINGNMEIIDTKTIRTPVTINGLENSDPVNPANVTVSVTGDFTGMVLLGYDIGDKHAFNTLSVVLTAGAMEVQSQIKAASSSTLVLYMGYQVGGRATNQTYVLDIDSAQWAAIDANTTKIGNTAMGTVATTLTGAIKEQGDLIKAGDKKMAIVVSGNTSIDNIADGNYVIVENSIIPTINDGLYIAANNVTAGTALVAADLSNSNTGLGGLNALNSNIPSVFQLKPGTSSTYSKMYAPGYISGSGAYIEVFINCDASKITSITNVTADRIDIKCKSGNILKTSGFSFNSAIKAPNGVLLEFAWGSTLSDQSTGCFFVLENVKFVCT